MLACWHKIGPLQETKDTKLHRDTSSSKTMIINIMLKTLHWCPLANRKMKHTTKLLTNAKKEMPYYLRSTQSV